MEYRLKNVSGSAKTISGESVANDGYLIIFDDENIGENIIDDTNTDIPNITELFNGSDLEYYQDSTIQTENQFWADLNDFKNVRCVSDCLTEYTQTGELEITDANGVLTMRFYKGRLVFVNTTSSTMTWS